MLKTLPDIFTKAQVDALIAMLPQDQIVVSKFDTIITVKAARDNRTVFSAGKPTRRNAWHVMAADGLFTKVAK